MKRIWARLLGLASVLVCLATAARADLQIRLRHSQNEGRIINETLLSFKGARQRNDLLRVEKKKTVPQGTVIFQCDLDLYLWLDTPSREFWRTPYQAEDFRADFVRTLWPKPEKGAKSGGTLRETYTLTDTGERRTLYGYTARRVKTSRVWESAPPCRQTPLRQETDGWYIDLLYGMGCSPNLSGTHNRAPALPETSCFKRYRQRNYRFTHQQTGTARLGFPLSESITTYDDQGRTRVETWAVTEFSDALLDDALFTVPEKFREIPPPYARRSLLDRLLAFLPWR